MTGLHGGARPPICAPLVPLPAFLSLPAQAIAVLTQLAAGLGTDQVAIESWWSSVACTFPAGSLTPPARLGGPLPSLALGPQLECTAPAVRPPSTPTDQTVVSAGGPQAGRNAPLRSAASPDTDPGTPAVAGPLGRTILPGTAGCGSSRFCEQAPSSAVERPDAREMPLGEPRRTPSVPAAGAQPDAGPLLWLGLRVLLWLALVSLFSLAAWMFDKRRPAPEVRLLRAAEAGLREGEFRLEYQPVMNLREGTCVAVEAMIRWTHAEYGPRGPAYYMLILEKTRLIARLTCFVLLTAACELAEPTAGSSLYIGVHVCAAHVHSKGFASDVSRSANPILSRLVLNMPEHDCAATTADVLHTVTVVRAKHVRFALANADQVPSDPARLEAFGFDQIKVDRHVRRSMGTSVVSA